MKNLFTLTFLLYLFQNLFIGISQKIQNKIQQLFTKFIWGYKKPRIGLSMLQMGKEMCWLTCTKCYNVLSGLDNSSYDHMREPGLLGIMPDRTIGIVKPIIRKDLNGWKGGPSQINLGNIHRAIWKIWGNY